MNATMYQQKQPALILIERTLAQVALDYANGENLHVYAGFYDSAADDPWDQITEHYETWAVNELVNALGALPSGFLVNWDPRGHQLKISPEANETAHLPADWGGYGLLAPNAYTNENGGSI